MSVIALHGVSKSFKGIPVLSDVHAEFEEGRTHGVVGHNGSGKSVLFKLICRFLLPDSGEVVIDPRFMSRSRSFPQGFGAIIDKPGYHPDLTGADNLRRLAEIRGKIGDPQIFAAMEAVGLSPTARQKVRHYSLGMRQKLALAQAFMEDQRVLILDEPFNALDSDSVEMVRALLTGFNAEGRTIIFTSHNADDMRLLADSTYRINNLTLEKER